MNKPTNLDYNIEFEEQLLIGEDLEKLKAKKFVNLLSELFFKYEDHIKESLLENMELIGGRK